MGMELLAAASAVAGRELFLNRTSCTTLDDFLLNYAALTFSYVNGKVLFFLCVLFWIFMVFCTSEFWYWDSV